jgi:hypothetical protein
MITSSQHPEKRKRDDVDVQEVGGAPMDTSNECIANTQHVTIGDLQEYKYWNNICQRADELNQYLVDCINEDQLIQVMGLPPTETEEFRNSIKNQRTALLLKKDAIVTTFESFLRTTCTNVNQELEETYRVIGYASRIIYELANIKVIKEVEAELQLCKGALDRVVLTSAAHREDQSKAQLASILKSLDILSDEIDSLRGGLSAHEESLRQLSEMPATDLREMQKMQISNLQRSDRTTEQSKVRRLKNLRDEAIRLASATILPTHLGEYQLRTNDIL